MVTSEPSSTGPPPASAGQTRLPAAVEALGYRNFRLFWIGGLISGIGRFFQFVAIPAVIWELTDSPGWVGFVGFTQIAPMALIAPVAGPLADRHSRRQLLLVTQSAQAVVAATLALLWWADIREPLVYVAMSALVGLTGGLNLPAWQAFVSELVPRTALLNAVTLNSTQFNASRMVGPVLAGLALGTTVRAGGAFAVNAASFLAAITALVLIDTPGVAGPRLGRIRPWRDLVATVGYIRGQSGISTAVVVVAMVGMFGLSIQVLVIVFAEDVFHRGASGFGLMLTMVGVGSVAAAPFVASMGDRFKRSRVQVIALTTYGLAIVGVAVAPVFGAALGALAVMGAAHLTSASVLNTTIQLQVEESRRAKVLAVYMMALLLANPLGQLGLGQLIELIGPRPTFAISGAALTAAAVVLRVSGRLHRLDGEGGQYEPEVLSEVHPTIPSHYHGSAQAVKSSPESSSR